MLNLVRSQNAGVNTSFLIEICSCYVVTFYDVYFSEKLVILYEVCMTILI